MVWRWRVRGEPVAHPEIVDDRVHHHLVEQVVVDDPRCEIERVVALLDESTDAEHPREVIVTR